MVNIHNYLEEKQINIYIGKDDSALIKFVRLLYNKEDEIKFLIAKEEDSAMALSNKLNISKGYVLKYKNIFEYQYCFELIKNSKEKTSDIDLLFKLKEKLDNNDINFVLETFKNYFMNFESIKSLDLEFDSSK